MVKIGGGSAPRRRPIDPFEGLERSLLGDDGLPHGHSWGVFSREINADLAREWFGFLPSIPVSDWVRQQANSPDRVKAIEEMVGHLGRYQEGVVFPDLMRDSSDLGERVLFSQSSCAPKVLDYFARNGVTGTEVPVAAMGSGVADLGETTAWLGPWGTSFGSRANVWFEIRRAADGSESAYVFTNLCVATRPQALQVAQAFTIPTQAAALLYTAETTFPSAIMRMSRSLSWPDAPEDLIPSPFLTLDEFGLVCATIGDSPGGQVQTDFGGYPLVLRAGYLLPETSMDHLPTLMPPIIETLTNAQSIVEDGFRNYRNAMVEASFDFGLGSEYVLLEEAEEGGSAQGLSRWVPEIFIGDLLSATREAIYAVQSMPSGPEEKSVLDWIVNDGAGWIVGVAINTLVYSYLLPTRDFERAERLLNTAIAMEIVNESSNALANLGQVFLAQGKREAAVDMFTQALERFDNYAEAEASYFLGLLALEDGDRDGARAFFLRGAESKNGDVQRDMCREKLTAEF